MHTLCCKELWCPAHNVYFLYIFHYLLCSIAHLSLVFFPFGLMRISLFFFFSVHCFCPLCLICALYFSPPLEIKLHFAAVAIPGRLDQGRAPLHGLSLPPVEASGTEGLGETSLRARAWWPGVVVLSHILPRQFWPLILLILSPINRAGCGRGKLSQWLWEISERVAEKEDFTARCAHVLAINVHMVWLVLSEGNFLGMWRGSCVPWNAVRSCMCCFGSGTVTGLAALPL